MSDEIEMNEEMIDETEEIKEEAESEAKAGSPDDDKAAKKAAKDEKKDEKKLRSANEKLKKELKAAGDELAEQKDKYLRMMAEYENFRRRAAKERDEIYARAYGDVLEAILPVMDNLERAAGYGGSDAEQVTKGVKMTLDAFAETLGKLGVEEIACEPGTKFDPQIHNAVMHAEDEDFGENEIAQVFTKGYKKGDRVLRHPMVKVVN